MPTIQNFALHAFDLPPAAPTAESPKEKSRLFFPAGVNAGQGKVNPSETSISSEDLARVQGHNIGGAWFGPAGLVVKPETVESDSKAPEGEAK